MRNWLCGSVSMREHILILTFNFFNYEYIKMNRARLISSN